MSFSVDLAASSRVSKRLTAASIKDLSALILRAESPTIASADVIGPLMGMLVGGPLDLQANYRIRDPSVFLLFFELLPHFSETLQVEIWTTLGSILQRSLSNVQSCQQLRLVERCLDYLRSTPSDEVAHLVVKVIEVVGGYSVSLKELQGILSYLYTGQTESWAPHSTILLAALSSMSANMQPDVFFSFSGAPGAALTLPPLTKWPTQSGFTFNTWIRLEKPEGSQRENYRPTIYWFRTGRPELGYSAHVVSSKLVLETVSKGKKPQVHRVDFAFQSYRWYMITVSYVHNRVRNSQLSCSVNGKPLLQTEVTLPATDDVFDKCFLGSSPASTADLVFQGQMAAAYLFREPLGKETVSALHKLGPSYKSQFRFDSESDVFLMPEDKKVLFDGRLSSSILFSYNAKAVDGQLCLEASPNENQSFFAHSPHATLLEGVGPIKTTKFHNIFHSLGGVQALIPLFSQLDTPQDSDKVDYTLSGKLLSLVFKLGCNAPSFLFQLVQMNAMELLGYLLEKVSPDHLSLDLLSSIFDFMDCLLKLPSGGQLACQVVENLLFNPALWIKAHKVVQIQLYSRMAARFSVDCIGNTGVYLRDLVDTNQLLFIMREHYSLEGGGQSAECNEVHTHIRSYLLLIMKTYFTKGKGIQKEDMRTLLDYLCSVQNEENLHDVLGLMLALVFEDHHHPGNIVNLFYDEGGINVAAKLLACASEDLTLNALKLIGIVLHHLPQEELQDLLSTVELLAVVREKLLSAGQPVTVAMFNTLYEVLVGCPVRKIIDHHYVVLDLAHQIKYPRMLAVMIELICSLHTSQEDWEDQDTVMRIQLFSYILSLCKQSNHNCKALLKLQHWPHWFLMLSDQPEAKEPDRASLQKMVYKLFHVMLVYTFQEEVDGWKLWVEIASSLHAYMMSRSEEEEEEGGEGRSEVLQVSDSPTDLSSDSYLDSGSSRVDVESELDSADSSMVSLTAATQNSPATEDPAATSQDTPKETTPPISPLVQAAAGRLVWSVKGSPSLSHPGRQSSSDNSLFMPKDPFLDLEGKIAKFRWTAAHISLLEELLNSIMNKWRRRPSQERSRSSSISDYLGNSANRFLRSNVIHLLGLTTDSILALNGGLRHLLSLSSNPKQSGKKHNSLTRSRSMSGSGDCSKVRGVLKLCLELAELVLLGGQGQVKLPPIETKLRMDMGGIIRQTLRLVLGSTSLDTIQANTEHRNSHLHYSEEKLASVQLLQDSLGFLQSLGLRESSLSCYFESSHKQKLQELRTDQQLLSVLTIAHFKSLIARDKDNKVLLQQMVILIMYYLSTMCVFKYSNILSSKPEREGVTSGPSEKPDQKNRSDATPTEPSRELDQQAEEEEEGERGQQASKSPQSAEESSALTEPGSQDVSEQIEASMELLGPFLCELLVEHKGLLSKVLVGADGRQLISDAVLRLTRNKSVVEMTMLLCSQEWQTALKKSGGKIFSDLLLEGKKMARLSENHLRSTASRATASHQQNVNIQAEKFTDFEEGLSLFLSRTIKSSNEEWKLKRADIIRHTVSAKEQWRKISSVVNEKGFFDSTPLRETSYWKLDLKENSLRQHLQLLANPSGSVHKEAVRTVGMNGSSEETTTSTLSIPTLASRGGGHVNLEEASFTSEDLLESLLPFEEQVVQLLSVQCSRVVLAHAVPGTLVLTKSSVAFTADDSTSQYEKALCMEGYCTLNDRKLLEDVTAVISRRYLHQNKALEVFFADRTSIFLTFESSSEAGEMVRRLPKVGIGPQYDLPQARSISLASPQQLFRKSTMTAKWERREISNFEYLIFLNTIAGRSYNDLNQYPVFPWILKDYSSQKLDLSNPDTFRDLTKPMGAINPDRLEQFEERYANFEDDTLPPFYYGTHYSTMAFVLHWLVRLEPFSTLHINFHDGLFDQSSRLFTSLQDSWTNSTQSSSDVNELIPEFYYLPEMFQNDNKFNFGRSGACGDGDVIDHVQLPPWASSVHEFVHTHREALESEYVSCNLHHWIDLIFGYKQRGAEAVKAKNVFYYLTYPGSVNLDTIEEPALRRGLEDQIRQFGQTPSQLLNEPHPPRQELRQSVAPQPVQGLNPKDSALLAELQVTPDVPIALVQLSSNKTDLLVVSCNQLYAINKWILNSGTSKNITPTVAIEPDKQIASGLRSRLGDPLDHSVTSPGACFTSLPSCTVIIVCGFWDNSFKSFDTNSGDVLQSVFGHRHIVSCMDFAPEEGCHAHTGAGLIATGSHDATVLLWRWSGKLNRVVGSLVSQSQGDSPTPLSVCTGHRQPVACVSVSSSLGIVASGPKYGSTLVHSISGELLHNISPSSHLLHPHLVRITRTGHLVLHYADQKGCLAVYTCNGKLLSQLPLDGPALALAVSKDGRFVISGGFDRTVRVFSTYNLSLRYTHPPSDSRIRSLHVSEDQRFVFAGLASGSVLALSTHTWMSHSN